MRVISGSKKCYNFLYKYIARASSVACGKVCKGGGYTDLGEAKKLQRQYGSCEFKSQLPSLMIVVIFRLSVGFMPRESFR